jgi:hypothetical protein
MKTSCVLNVTSKLEEVESQIASLSSSTKVCVLCHLWLTQVLFLLSPFPGTVEFIVRHSVN